MRLTIALGALLLSALCCLAGTVEDYARNIAPLIDPAKLATLGPRGANQRVQKVTYWMAMAKKDKRSTSSVAWQAVLLAGYTNKDAQALTMKGSVLTIDNGVALVNSLHAPFRWVFNCLVPCITS